MSTRPDATTQPTPTTHTAPTQPQRTHPIARATYLNTSITCRCDHNPSGAPIIVETPLALHTNRKLHCPLCNATPSTHATSTQQTDVHHIQAVHANVPYAALKLGLNFAKDYFTAHPSKRNALKLPNPSSPDHDTRIAFEDAYMAATRQTATQTQAPNTQSTSAPSSGVCYISCTCHTCGSTFQITRNTTSSPDGTPRDASLGAITYCPFCGSATLTLTPCSTEETAWLVLSSHYNVPVQALQVMYDLWVTDSQFSTYHTFASFLNAFGQKANAQLTQRRQNAPAQPTTPTAQPTASKAH